MKKFCLMLVNAGFLLIGLSEIQAQTIQAKPNQVELIKQFIGNWKAESGKDTVYYVEVKPFGTGIETYAKTVVKDKMISEEKALYGYDNKLDKFVGGDLIKGTSVGIYALWFTSNNKFEAIPFTDISSPDKASWKQEDEIKSPDFFSQTSIMNGKVVVTYNFKRIK